MGGRRRGLADVGPESERRFPSQRTAERVLLPSLGRRRRRTLSLIGRASHMSQYRTSTLITPELAAIVDVFPPQRTPQVVWAVAKRTYRLTERGLVLDAAKEL